MCATETEEAADRGIGNYRLLLRLNFFLGIGLGIVSTAELFDLLYLRMGFDLSWFGLIRGCMFLLPALSYFAAAPLLKGTRNSREIMQWSFLIRIAAAVLIPLAALCTKNRHGLLAAAALGTSIAFVAAVFGSNTLMMLYRQLLPEEEFNRRNAVITAIFNIVPGLVGLLGAGALSLASGLADREFYALFILLEIGTGVFELALFRINKKLTFSAGGGPAPEKVSYADHFRRAFDGFSCPVYRQFLLIAAANHFFSALPGTYIGIYLYKVHDASAFTVALIGNIAVFGGNLFGIAMARRCDRIGYLEFFRQGSLALVVLTLLFGFFPGSMVITVLFLLFIYNGASGLLAGPLLMMRGAAAAKLAPDKGGEPYVAAYSLILRLFSFAGSIAASRLFLFCQDWTGGGIPETFAAFFKAAGITGIILFLPLYNRGSALLDKKQPSPNA